METNLTKKFDYVNVYKPACFLNMPKNALIFFELEKPNFSPILTPYLA